ncbi:energy transducer TonB [Altererythrobacter arenosus]|uniref:Energy transducer TonB n=1 Tax=Altererythrobacter arenosus TaxID=3032592 RepID=A0ABY8FMM9_9SPHN|nr:energy transducer TonB [Altererythrobacter sp. CAU 1644]WFL76284.1 energy transducer TonB [Altererythrobacter sp. CAU 1644]
MEATQFRREERIGLGIALGLHLLLAAVLMIQPSRTEVLDIPERMTVSLAEEVGLEATAPEPVPESRASIAPTLADEPAPTVDQPRPQPSATVQPDRNAITSPRPRNTPQPRATSSPKPATGGGSRVGNDFLGGAGSSTRTDETRIPASQIGASAKASLQQALARQIRPHWNAPSGVDVELLVTLLDFDLDEDGRLKGRPTVRGQSGINESNRPQANIHAERAIAAVIKAAPFDLPPEYYNAWKSIRGARFDRNLSR